MSDRAQMQERIRELEAEVERLRAASRFASDMLHCSECGGLHNVAALISRTADPESDPICRPCAEVERLKAEVAACEEKT